MKLFFAIERDCGRYYFCYGRNGYDLPTGDCNRTRMADARITGPVQLTNGSPASRSRSLGVGYHDGGRFRQGLDRTLGEQLADISLDYNSFDFLAFSHMHLDHVGVANEIKGAQLLIPQAEYDIAFAEEVPFGYVPALYEGPRDMDRQILDGEHDVFGDGRVRIIPAPGHTPGHQVLFVDLEKTGPIVLSGDLYHLKVSRRDRLVPGYNFDWDATLASMERVEKLIRGPVRSYRSSMNWRALNRLRRRLRTTSERTRTS